MNLLVQCIPTWLLLKKITNSIVGKCLLILSVGIPVTKLSAWGIDIPALNLAVLGALLALLSWVVTVLNMPNRIRESEDGYSFADNALNRYRVGALNPAIELMWVTHHRLATYAATRSQLPQDFITRFPLVESLQTSQSQESTVYYYSRIAYECDNGSRAWLRTVSTVLAVIGVALIYNSAIASSVKIILGILHVN